MGIDIEVTIPSTSIETQGGPYTLYHILIRHNLRSYQLFKRYSEFVTLVKDLENEVKQVCPFKIPGKQLFKRTVSSPELTLERKNGLELFLKSVINDKDLKWRSSFSFLEFLQLAPGTFNDKNNINNDDGRNKILLNASWSLSSSKQNETITDSAIWLDTIRECKSLLQQARSHVLESPSESRKCLIMVGSKVTPLIKGLEYSSKNQSLGTGELRRRGDLLLSLRREYGELDTLIQRSTSHDYETGIGSTTSSNLPGSFPNNLIGNNNNNINGNNPNSLFSEATARRVLGKTIGETKRTKNLNNQELLQLEKSDFEKQDESLKELRKIVQRQKEIGLVIHDEIILQNELLDGLDDDVENSKRKLTQVRKKADKLL